MHLGPTILDTIALALAVIHFATPLAYYYYMRRKHLGKPWGLTVDPGFQPRVTIIVPTFNEAGLVKGKLDNIYSQEYPRDRVEIIVVDSASTDGTPDKVREWAEERRDVRLTIIEEPVRRGMVPALNYALKHVSNSTNIIVFTDADAFWERDTLRKVVSYFADPSVGAVTTCIAPLQEDIIEDTYRDYYNVIRVAESKIHSTPIHNGALIAYRKELLDKIGGLPTYTGNNDSTPASLIAFMGYRAIQVDDTIVREPIRKGQVMRKIRRAQHLVLHFINTRRYARKLGIYRKTPFDKIWIIEAYLHLINPWLLLIVVLLLTASSVMGSITAIALLTLGVLLLFIKPYRTWISTQLYLVLAAIRSIWTKEIAWEK